MTRSIQTVIYPVKDLARAKVLYTALTGTAPHIDGPYYVGFKVGDQEIGLDPNGHASGMSGPICYWHVADIRASVRGLLEAGAQMQQEVKDVGGGKLIATLRDADGNVIGLIQMP